MSIAKRQIVRITDKILEDAFKRGEVLTVDQLIAEANKVFREISIGQPITKYRPAKSRERSVPEDWNKTVEELYIDLNTLYDENVEQMQRIIADFDYFEVEQSKLERILAELEDRIDELLLLNNNSDGYLYSAYDQFRNLKQIDMSLTSAWIDLKLNHVCLPYAKAGNVKLDLINQPISGEVISTEGVVSSVAIEPLSNILNDNLNTAWVQKIVTTKQMEVSYQVNLELTGEEVTRLLLNPNVPGKTKFTILYTEDGLNWKVLSETIGQELLAFDFTQAWFRGLRIILSKSEYDEIETGPNGENYYVYFVGINNLSLLKLGFENYAEFVSAPLEIKNRQEQPVKIDTISLEVVDEIPQECSINYYVAFEKEGDSLIDWQPINPTNKQDNNLPKMISLKSISSTHPLLSLLTENATEYSENNQTRFNGLKFWWLNGPGSISESANLVYGSGFPQLYKGIKQFRQEKYHLVLPAGAELHMPSLTDWIQFPVDSATKQTVPVATKYLNIGTSLTFPSEEQMYSYRYTTSLYFDKAQTVRSTITMNSSAPEASLNLAILVNGMPVGQSTKLIPGTSMIVEWPFTDGWNTVQILVYKPDNNNYSSSLTLHTTSERNPFTATEKVRVDQEPMVFVPLFEYLYNIYEKETDKYSISSDNRIVISDYQKNQGARYDFYYRYTIDQGYTNVVRVKAELERGDNQNVTPKIIYYKVRVT